MDRSIKVNTDFKADPWYKTTLPLEIFGTKLSFDIPHDVFSTQRIDEGTILLLEHLPNGSPKKIFDLGCGYGALGLPIAAKFKDAQVDMVDRDLLAVEWCARNAKKNGLSNVNAFGSLGFRDLDRNQKYDWIFCNVPARIGTPFINQILTGGKSRLTDEGKLIIVVIRDLGPVIEDLCRKSNWIFEVIVKGPRHTVYSFNCSSEAPTEDSEDLYVFEKVQAGTVILERPFDLGGDEPRRLAVSLPLLIDALPRQAPQRVVCFRGAYGAIPLTARKRWPNAEIVAIDRDLLATTFIKRNARLLNLDSALLKVCSSITDHSLTNELPFDLALIELSPSAGEKVAIAEIEKIKKHLKPGGQALLITLDKFVREWIKPFATKSGLAIHTIIAREGYTVSRFQL